MAKTILIVDDEDGIRDLLVEYFAAKGYNILEATDGVEALNYFTLKQIDLIISDIRMPRMSGLQLLKAVKKININLPVILITGYQVYNSYTTELTIKADGYISKPFTLDTINKLVVDLLK